MNNQTNPKSFPSIIATGLLAGIVALCLGWLLSAGTRTAEAGTVAANIERSDQPAGMVIPAHPSGERNIALDLWRLWDLIGHTSIRLINDSYSNDIDWTPDDRVANALVEINDSLNEIVRVVRYPLCDFQPRYEEGISLLLPQLAKMRLTAIILASDARRLTVAGEHDKAAERIEAIIRIAGHASSDRVMISSLVGAAILNVAKLELERLSERGRLTDDGKARILVALDQSPGLEADDLLRFRQAIEMERDVLLGGLKTMLRKEDAGEMLTMLGATSVQSAMMRAMTDAAIEAEIQKGRRYYGEVLEAWDADDAAERMAALEARVEQRREGLFTSLMAPAVTKMHTSYRNAVSTKEAIRAMVAGR